VLFLLCVCVCDLFFYSFVRCLTCLSAVSLASAALASASLGLYKMLFYSKPLCGNQLSFYCPPHLESLHYWNTLTCLSAVSLASAALESASRALSLCSVSLVT